MDAAVLWEKLSRYGADMEGVDERFFGDAELYEDCLRIFFEDKNFALLGDAAEKNDAAGAFPAAHALKGVAGNLGLTPLYKAVCKMVEAVRDTDACHANLAELYGEIRVQLALLKEQMGI